MTAQQRLARLTGIGPKRGGSAPAARAPFVLLIVALLGAGMLILLILNASLNEGSFRLSELRSGTQELTDEQQQLQAEVDAFSAPAALAERARDLGLVPGGPPAFLDPDGAVLGDPQPAPEPEEVDDEDEEDGPPPEEEHGPVSGRAGAADDEPEDAPEADADAGAEEPDPDADAEAETDADANTDADTGAEARASASEAAEAEADQAETPESETEEDQR